MKRIGLSKRKPVAGGSSRDSGADDNVQAGDRPPPNQIGSNGSPTAADNATLIVSRPNTETSVIEDSVTDSPSPEVISAPLRHSLFSSVLQRHGYIVGTHQNQLQYHSMQFRKRMFEWVNREKSAKHRVESELERFITATKLYLSTRETLRLAMKITFFKEDASQPCLLHCLLGVENLQTMVVEAIMPILMELSLSTAPDDVSLAESMLKELTYLPDIIDGSSLLAGLLECLENGLTPVQKLIIQAIPLILPPKHHEEIVDKLLPLFVKFSHLIPAFVDSFSTLSIDNDATNEKIRTAALEKMFQVQLADLPALFSFLLGTDNISALEDTILSIRENLVLRPAKRDAKNEAYLMDIVNKLRFFVSLKHDVVSIWTKQVKEDCSSEDQTKAIDLVVLLVIAESSTKNTSAIHMLFANRKLTMQMLNDIIEHTKPILFQLFPTLFNACETILREKNEQLFPVVSEILEALFRSLSPFEAQTIVFNLSTLVVNGSSACQDSALSVFSNIAEKEPKKLQMFAANLMGIWDHRVKFTNLQTRSLMNVLATIAHIHGSTEENSFKSEFNILLRKQLTHHDLAMKCCGVMGALATVRRLGLDNEPDENEMQQLLHLTWTCVERDRDTCRIFFDELSECIQWLPTSQCIFYRDLLRDKFEVTWTDQEVSVATTGRGSLEMSITYDANKEIADRIVLVFEEKPMSLSPIVLPAHLRVVTALENRVEDKNLENIDAILGLPIMFPTISKYYERKDLKGLDHGKKFHLGQYLVLAINFFRESVSSFVNETTADLRIKVWFRLSNIVVLQKMLVKHFQDFPSLPSAYMSNKNNDAGALGPVAGPSSAFGNQGKNPKRKPVKKGKKAKTGNKKGKKMISVDSDVSDREKDSESAEEHDISNSTDSEAEEDKIVESVTKDLVEEIQPKHIYQYLRRLDIKVFSLLKFPLSLDDVPINYGTILANLATEASMNVLRNVEVITTETLAFLLAELNWQTLETANKFDLLKVDELLNSLLSHFEAINAAYKSMGEGKRKHAECCHRLLINSLTCYFDAVAASDGDRAALIAKSVRVIAVRCIPGSSASVDDLPVSELVAYAAEFLANISKYVLEPETAADHIKLLKNVHDLLDNQEQIKVAVDAVVKTYLSKNWKLSSSQITFFLKSWLSMSPNPIKVIHGIASSLIPLDAAQIPCTDFYKTCNKSNFQTWFSIMVSGVSHHAYKYGRKNGDYSRLLELWSDAMGVFKTLVTVAQKEQTKSILLPLLKNGRLFLEAFITGGTTIMPQMWRIDTDRAKKFCKDLQQPTRIIQQVCEHSKVVKDPSMVRYVPLMKKSLERLVFRVREILSEQRVTCAFWMDNLKHRCLDGDIRQSQIDTSDTENSESEKDEFTNAIELESGSNTESGRDDSEIENLSD